MKKQLVPFLLLTLLTAGLYAQVPVKTLKQTLKLVISDSNGRNGAAVAWHPVQKKYYAAMAGNAVFPLMIFDATGKKVNPKPLETGFDIRGLWYNPISKTLQMNGYADYGWAEYKLDSKGLPTGVNTLLEGQNQPDYQSAGAYNHTEKKVYFFNSDGDVDVYDAKKGTLEKTIPLRLGIAKGEESEMDDNYEVIEDYNTSNLVYTGIKKAEIGLLNSWSREIELYDQASGYLVRKLKLPEEAPVESVLNFSFANGRYWLFDITNRCWYGYQ